MKRIAAALLALMMLLAACTALAEKVVFEDLQYGEAAFQLHLKDETNTITFQGETYSLNDDAASYESKVDVYGGKTRAVYEMTIPADKFTVEDNGEETVLGEWVISIPYRAKLWVATGNRVSGEYVVEGPIDLTAPYTEQVVIPRDENGHPLLIDRIYLYQYEVGEEVRRFAASLYVDYEGYLAGRPAAVTAASEQPRTMPLFTTGAGIFPVAVGMGVCVLAAAVAVVLLKRKKRAAKAVAVVAPEDVDLMAQGTQLLEAISRESEMIETEDVKEKALVLCRLLRQLLDSAKENPQRLGGMRKLITYYLPVAQKLLAFWRSNETQDVDESKRAEAHITVTNGLDMVIDAFRKKLNNLHDAQMMDISAELSALDQMLKREGLKDPRLKLTLGETAND